MATLIEKHESVIYSYRSPSDGSALLNSSLDFQLISLLDALPLMPMPWVSADEGEGFVWGSFIILFQKDPLPLICEMQKRFNNKTYEAVMQYPYSVSVFYHPDCYPSKCPILSLGLERCTLDLGAAHNNPLFVGMFHKGGFKHTNYGEYKGELTPTSAKECLFSLLKDCFQLSGDPHRVGTIKETISALSTIMDRALHGKLQNSEISQDEKALYQDLAGINNFFSDVVAGSVDQEEAAQFSKRAAELLLNSRQQEVPPDVLSQIPLMDILKHPSMPMPFSSSDEGEIFKWDRCLCIFQKQSRTVAELTAYDKVQESGLEMRYPYAMAVTPEFCKKPTALLIIGIEECIIDSYQGPPMLGMFFKDQHYNFGRYDEELCPEKIKLKFFSMIKSNLDLKGSPQFIGTIPQLFPAIHAFLKKTEPHI